MSDIYEPPQRPERPREAQLHAWWTTQRTQSVDNLEAAARQDHHARQRPAHCPCSASWRSAARRYRIICAGRHPLAQCTGRDWLVCRPVMRPGRHLSFPQTVVRNDPAGNADAFEALLRQAGCVWLPLRSPLAWQVCYW